jgi:two-component system chemotaxis response regulator CheY
MSKKIIVVDDSKSTRTMVTFTLRRAGYEVVEAENGSQALALVEGQAPDGVITDLNMPVMDGLELIRRLRAGPATRVIPILMLTTSSDVAQREQGQTAGANAWLSKPFLPASLVEAIAKLL